MSRPRGFQRLSPEERARMARAGAEANVEAGTAHQWKEGKEAREAGRRGGLASQAARRRRSASSEGEQAWSRRWEFQTSLAAHATRQDGRSLQIVISTPDGLQWHTVAADTGVPRGQIDDAHQAISAVLSHAHHLLPESDSLPSAIAQAEKYIRWWQRSGAKPMAECACDEIADAASAGEHP